MLSNLIREIIKADASYFLENNFISEVKHQAVIEWLGGTNDSNTQLLIAGWLESDSKYFIQLRPALSRRHWYIFPLMWIFVSLMAKRLIKSAKELRKWQFRE